MGRGIWDDGLLVAVFDVAVYRCGMTVRFEMFVGPSCGSASRGLAVF